ncbi:MAG: peptidoglycan-binding protein, partial [Methylocella sp.]
MELEVEALGFGTKKDLLRLPYHHLYPIGRAAAVVVTAFGLMYAAGAGAGPGELAFGEQAEWAQRYDADPRLSVSRSNTPVLAVETFAATEQAIETYRQIVANGGWLAVPAGQTLKLGVSGQAVVALRKRLAASGDLDPSAGASPVFDSYVDAAVKHFQARHGLLQSGVVSKET